VLYFRLRTFRSEVFASTRPTFMYLGHETQFITGRVTSVGGKELAVLILSRSALKFQRQFVKNRFLSNDCAQQFVKF
jgi:hypothetical protein